MTTNSSLKNDEHTEPTLNQLCGLLYHACLQKPDENYTQAKLLKLSIVPQNDLGLLLNCVNALCNQRRFKHATVQNADCWQVVRGEDTARYKGLTQDESVVLVHIDDSQREGIWVRHIRLRSNLTQNTVNNALKKLEQHGIVKQVTNVKFPLRKYYMLAHLQPSEEITGGPFFSDGILDEEYVYNLSKIIYNFINKRSWERQFTGSETSTQHDNSEVHFLLLPMPSDHSAFPTISDILDYVQGYQFSSIKLGESDIKQLLDLLCWDGYISMTADGKGYRSMKAAVESFDNAPSTNGYAETPCGNCPVFDWCEDTGLVNPKTCAYLTDWLSET